MCPTNKSKYLTAILSCILLFVVGLREAPAAASPTLKGGVAESQQQIIAAQNRALGFATTTEGTAPVKKVSAVFLGTPAFYKGLREGDQIISQTTKEVQGGLQSIIVFSRNGGVYQISLTSIGDFRHYLNGSTSSKTASVGAITAWKPPPQQPPIAPKVVAASRGNFAPSASTSGQPAGPADQAAGSTLKLSAKKDRDAEAVALLKNRDLAVLIDRSGSMATTDCPQATSRWEWCRQQALQFSNQVQADFPTGFTLVLFNNHEKVLQHADLNAVNQAFSNNKPDGGTDTAGAVASQLRAHNSDKEAAGRSLVLVIITDGEPNDEKALRKTLITAANEATKEDDLSVVFLQVGEDNEAGAYLEDLDLNLTQEGAKFHIVHAVTFEELRDEGLLRAIATALPRTASAGVHEYANRQASAVGEESFGSHGSQKR